MPDPATEPTEADRRASRALAGAVVAELRRLKAANVQGAHTPVYASTSHSDGSFHPTDFGNDAAGTDPAARGTRAA